MKKVSCLVVIFIITCFTSLYAQDALFYKKYADKGDKEALYNLAMCYYDGLGGVEKNDQLAFYYMQKAAKKKYVTAQAYMSLFYAYGIGVTPNCKVAYSYALKSYGNPISSCVLGLLYEEGCGVSANLKTAYSFYKKAADDGSGFGQYKIGTAYLNGQDGFVPDIKKALYYLKAASDNDDKDAQTLLAFSYYYGYKLDIDYEEAIKYAKLASDSDPLAQTILGLCYLYGNGTKVNNNMAVDWLRVAAMQGNGYALFELGRCYFYGWGVDEDQTSAFEYWKKSSEAECVEAYSWLGVAYLVGQGTAVNYSRGIEWLKKSAEKENSRGMYYYGRCFFDGIGVTQDYSKAVYWLGKSAALDNDDANSLLYLCYSDGLGCQKNITKAIDCLKKAVKNNHADSQCSLAIEYLYLDNVSRNIYEGKKLLKEAADNGSVWAQVIYGIAIYDGEYPFNKDFNEAFKYLQMAVSNSSDVPEGSKCDVYRRLGACYRFGRGTEVDQSMASYYTELAAKYGDKKSSSVIEKIR